MTTVNQHGRVLEASYSSTDEIVGADLLPGKHTMISASCYSTRAGTLTAYQVDDAGVAHALTSGSVVADTPYTMVIPFPVYKYLRLTFTPAAATAGTVKIDTIAQ